ncbi:MAG: ATP-binding protein [Bacteroidales bacterium]|jgi:signal transduction histidine kinase/CheY-like chemotaxis protein
MRNKQDIESEDPDNMNSLRDRIQELEARISQYEHTISELELKNIAHIDVINHVPLAMISLDAFGYIKLINSSFSKLFDYAQANQNQHIHISRFLQFDDNKLSEKISRLLDDHIQFDIETKISDLGASDSYFRVRGISITNGGGKATAHLIIIGNITQRRLAEKNLILAKEKAEEGNILKTAFLSNLSHEIRTPLNHILGFLELLLMEDLPSEDREEYTQIVRGSSDILLKRIEDVINISKIETRQMDVHNDNLAVAEIVKNVFSESKRIQHQHNKQNLQVVINEQTEYGNLIISADIRKVHQILINFLDNAVIFTNVGKIEIGYFVENKNGVCFYVKDPGIGIAPEFHESIFEHFRQVDNSPTRVVGGSGLGLAIASGMAKLMNGFISLDSTPGQGSTFYLHLPESIISVDSVLPANKQVVSEYNWIDKNIMVADYELVNFNLINVMLAKTKANLHWAKTGENLMSHLKERKEDLIVLDVDIPGIPLVELIDLIKQQHNEVRILAIGNELELEQTEMLEKSQVDKILFKPIEKATLLQEINRLLTDA